LPSRAISLSLMNYVFLITESYVRVVTNYCVVLFTDNNCKRQGNRSKKIPRKAKNN